MSVNERLEELVKMYSNGVVSQFAKRIGVSHTSIASMMPGSRESKPGFEIIEKIVETFPEINTTWLLTGEGKMLKGESKSGQYSYAGRDSIQAGKNITQNGNCEQQLALAQLRIEGLESEVNTLKKYIALLEKNQAL
jgi:transcriptional regulator with XRE-family HTH domain